MSETLVLVLIIVGIILLVVIYKWLKPYILRYNTTICMTGELGAGKTLTAVKLARVLIKKARFKVAYYNKIKRPIINKIRSQLNKKKVKKGKLTKPLLEKKRRPQLYSNLPICLNAKRFSKQKKPEYSIKLKLMHVLLLEKIPEGSIVLIDEFPQFINQFNWDEELVQHNVNEFITYFRHYYNSHLIITAQSVLDIVVQIRRKMNHATWAYGFKKHLFGLFYTIRMCDIMVNDAAMTMNTSQLEEDTKLHYGLFPPKGTYDTRAYSERTNNYYLDPRRYERFNRLKTNEILRIEKYISPLDDETTETQKADMERKAKQR